jgi:hypothetical protein
MHEWLGERGRGRHGSRARRHLGFHNICKNRQGYDVHKQLCTSSDGHICVVEERDQHCVTGGISGVLGQCMRSARSRGDGGEGVRQCDMYAELLFGGFIQCDWRICDGKCAGQWHVEYCECSE